MNVSRLHQLHSIPFYSSWITFRAAVQAPRPQCSLLNCCLDVQEDKLTQRKKYFMYQEFKSAPSKNKLLMTAEVWDVG